MQRRARVARAASSARSRATRQRGRLRARARSPIREVPMEHLPEIPAPGAGIQPTTVAVEAAITGVPLPHLPGPEDEIPGTESEKMRAGDPDVSPLLNEYSGEEVPGASTPTPDQNMVDDIGRAYGIEEEDTGALRTSAEILERRDRHRQD
jgi:hypothetical protein